MTSVHRRAVARLALPFALFVVVASTACVIDDVPPPSAAVCDTTTVGFARVPWSEPHVDPLPPPETLAPSGPPETFAVYLENPATANSHGLTYWLTRDEDLVQTYTVVLSVDWPHLDSVSLVSFFIDGIQVASDVDGVVQDLHSLPFPADNKLAFSVRIDGSAFTDGAHTMMMALNPFPDQKRLAFYGRTTVFKNGVDFAPFAPTVGSLSPRDESWTASRTVIRSENGLPDNVSAYLLPSADGSFDVDLVVQPLDDTPALCPGDPTVPEGVIAVLDARQIPFADGSLVLRVEPHQSERAIFNTRIEGLPLDADHRLELYMLGGLNRPSSTPSGEFSVWFGGTDRIAVVGW